jgi:exodeoxyribonuclease VII large subunit
MAANFFEFQEQMRRSRPAAPAAGAGREEQALSVSEVTSKIVKVLAGGMPPSVLVRGEVSNFGRNKGSGHLYFTLKDPDACLDCVMFRGDAARLKFDPADGMEMLASGRIGVYPQRGRYQLYVSTLRPLGQGALELAFQQVRAKLEAEGLFAAGRKKPLPAYPMRIVLVTSREAAAMHDVLKVLRRFPWLRLMLYPVPVQGDGAAQKIAAALAHINGAIHLRGGADLIVLARGGGSLEDLWCFNEEIVARAMAASRIPIITGIGHEVDVSIADLVADYHAHTPTEAAQVVTAQWRGAKDYLDAGGLRLIRSLKAVVSDARQRLRAIERHETFRRPADRVNNFRQLLDERQRSMTLAAEKLVRDGRERLQRAAARLERFLPGVLIRFRELLGQRRQQLDARIAVRLRASHERIARAGATLQEFHPRLRVRLASQRVDAIETRLVRAGRQGVESRTKTMEAMARQLEAISPRSVLRRGYTITMRKKDGLPLRSAQAIRPGDKLVTRFADGEVESVAGDSKQMSLFE